jgi:hypothetical protein
LVVYLFEGISEHLVVYNLQRLDERQEISARIVLGSLSLPCVFMIGPNDRRSAFQYGQVEEMVVNQNPL